MTDPQGAPPGPYQWQPPGPYQYQPPRVPVQPSSGFAVTALVTGIVGAVFSWVPGLGLLLGIIAVTFGGIGLVKANHGTAAGKGMAIAGLVLGILAIGVFILLIAVVASGG